MKVYNCLFCNKECRFDNRNKNKYCGNQCQQDFQYEKYIAEWKQGLIDGTKGGEQTSSYIHRYIRKKFNNTCTTCNNDKWLDEPITLELEHIDGDSANNKEDNLTILCPNCHSKTLTYKAKNKGNGRQSRRKTI